MYDHSTHVLIEENDPQKNTIVKNRLIDEPSQIQDAFNSACRTGNLEIVQYTLLSDKLSFHADLHFNEDSGFILAANGGHLEVIKFLLTSNELSSHADVCADNNAALYMAAYSEKSHVVKYILASNDLSKHADIHARDDYVFINAFKARDIDLLRFLIINCSIKKTSKIEEAIKGGNSLLRSQTTRLFEIRDFYEHMSQVLPPVKNSIPVKIKI